MDWPHCEKYLELRKENRIGRVWIDQGTHKLAPMDSLPGLDWQLAEWVSEGDLFKLIDELYLNMVRKGPVRDIEIKKIERMKYKLA